MNPAMRRVAVIVLGIICILLGAIVLLAHPADTTNLLALGGLLAGVGLVVLVL